MAVEKKRTLTRITSVSYDAGKYKSLHFHATAAAAATVLAAGYFNDFREELQVNDAIMTMAVADGVGDLLILKVTAVPAAPGDITVAVNSEASGS